VELSLNKSLSSDSKDRLLLTIKPIAENAVTILLARENSLMLTNTKRIKVLLYGNSCETIAPNSLKIFSKTLIIAVLKFALVFTEQKYKQVFFN